RLRPTVAAPRTWEELADPDLSQLEYEEVLERVADGLDPLGPLRAQAPDRLETYRSMRDPARTAEPVPVDPPTKRTEGAPTFVIHEHHARRLHWDFRLEHDGVLVSWAVPKGPPLDPEVTRLAVQTEDHPLEYGDFEGTIAKGEYGAGEVSIWDAGTCEIEKWRGGTEVIAVLHGREGGGLGGAPRRFALIHTGERNWLLKFMQDQPEDASRRPPVTLADLPAPMLATPGTPADVRLGVQDGEEWVFEMKWDGYRIIAGVGGGAVVLASRNGHDYTALFPQAAELLELLPQGGILDGELVALDERGRPDFGLLQAVAAGEEVETTLRYMVFDLLRLGKSPQLRTPYRKRRALLREVLAEGEHVTVPPAHTGSLAQAEKVSRDLGLEGVVAKRADSTYLPGKRGKAWLKLKTQLHQEVVVIGARHGKGGRAGGIGSLLLAVPDDQGVLRYAGRVGTGFTAAQLSDIEKLLRRLERKTPPVDDVPAADEKDAWWVTPRHVGEVALAGRTREGRVRQAVWRGWRADKDPGEVRWEL
ncbi:non-homologous end-joining DNA ligase, partial [Corynebacterium sp.]|uniref:non-homologous end-joining DNA ligase n=1 Tax=Corynebacterium sp. TaxID=1720 RepID=UPI0026E08623